MGQFFEYIKMALSTIRNNKGRSFLTMLGIIIGISSVIMIISIGNGVSAQISGELNNLAGGQLYIYSAANEDYSAVKFNEDDFDYLVKNLNNVNGVTATKYANGTVNGPKGQNEVFATAGNAASKYIAKEEIIRGGYFTEADVENYANVCVMRKAGAILMFGTDDVIGKTIEVNMNNFTAELKIVGIRDDNTSTLLNSMNDYEQVEIEMPITTYGNVFQIPVEEFDSFYIIGESPEHSKDIAKKAIKELEIRKKVTGQGVILLESFNDMMGEITNVVGMVTVFIVFVATISLLVGGIGVMNIMLVSVTERTREIGIRKALGARTKSILLQFLFESGIITLIGGLIGIFLGTTGAVLVCEIIGFSAKISLSTILIASVFSSAVGIFFGMYPAKRAAKLSPIEALRHE